MPLPLAHKRLLTFVADRVSTVTSDSDENAARQLGVPFLRLAVTEASEAEVAEWLKAIEASDAVAPNRPQAAPATTDAAS